MSAVFLPALPATIVANNADANAPASRVLLDEPGLVARAPGTLSLTFDMGGAAFNSVAAIGNNLTSDQTIRVRVGSALDMSGGVVLDVTVPAWSGIPPVGKAISYIPLPSTYTARYVRVDLQSGGTGTVEVSRVIVGKRIEVDGIDNNAQKTPTSGSTVDDGPGWTTVGEARTRLKWQANVGNIARDSFYREWSPFLFNMGKHNAFLFIPQTESDGIQVEAALVRNADDPKTVDVTSERFRVEMTLFEV